MSWLEDMIEPGIREQVKLLRENGFNTVSSCGHTFIVNMEIMNDGELRRLDQLLFNNRYRNYRILVEIRRVDGALTGPFAEIYFDSSEL